MSVVEGEMAEILLNVTEGVLGRNVTVNATTADDETGVRMATGEGGRKGAVSR